MIAAIAGLLACQLFGEILVRVLLLPLPGPVAGLGLLFLFLVWHGRGRDTLLRNLSLLFIPAAVGVVQYLDLLRANAAVITIAVAVSTILALVTTALTFRLMSRLDAFRHKEPMTPGDVESRRSP